jgi:phenylacetate-CoA ligase
VAFGDASDLYNYFRMAYDVASLLRHTRWSRERLLDYQDKRVREIVRYAFDNVPFYHDKFLKSGVRPDDVKSVADLNRLPIIRREELQENSGRIISSEFDSNRLNVVSTSGSSGKPLITYLTKREDEFRKAKLLRPHIVCGQKPWDRWVLIEPTRHIKRLGRLQRVLGFYAPVFVSIFDDVARQASSVEELDPEVLDGYSNSLFILAEEVERRSIKTIRPRFIMGGAELIDGASRRFVERVFDAPFFDQYASEELQMIAWQCPEKEEYHIDADSIVMQFVDEEGEEVAAGERGELVCTSLFNYAMPFVRYALGDFGVPSEQASCACGRSFPLMKVIEGRKDSMIVLPSGRRVPALVFGWIMEFYRFYRNIYQYRIVQKRVDHLRVFIKKKNGSADEREMELELVRHMKKMLDLSEFEVTVEVEFVDEIPLDKSGKLRKVVSELE